MSGEGSSFAGDQQESLVVRQMLAGSEHLLVAETQQEVVSILPETNFNDCHFPPPPSSFDTPRATLGSLRATFGRLRATF